MFGETTFASPEAVSMRPKSPTNCQRDHGRQAAERDHRDQDADEVQEGQGEDQGKPSKRLPRSPVSACRRATNPSHTRCGNS